MSLSFTRFAPPALLAAGVLLATPGAGRAQAAPDSAAYTIEGISVEVLRSRILAAAPWSLSVREVDQLRVDRAGAFLDDALRGLPGLQVQSRFNYAVGDRISVRGFGGRSQFGIRGVRILVDGIPATLPDGQSSLDHLDPSTLERVELLRGPSAAFWGNAAGGVLAFQSRLATSRTGGPPASDRVRLRGGGGSNGLAEGTVSWGGRVGAGAAEASVGRMEFGGYRGVIGDDPYGSARRWTASGRAQFPVAGGRLALALSGLDLDAANPGSLPLDRLEDPERPAWGFNVARRTRKTVRQGQIGASWTPDEGGFTAATWVIDREVFNPIPTSVIDLDRQAAGARVSVEGARGPLRWALAGEAERQSDDRLNFDNDGGDPGARTLDQRETVTGLALAGQLFLDRGPLLLSGAARIDRTRFSATDRFTEGGDPDDSGARTLTAPSLSLGAAWRLSDAVSLFGSTGSFFETPTTTELVNRPDGSGGFNPDVDPRTGWNAETGVRFAHSGRSLRVEGEVVGYSAWIRDELVPFEVASQPGRTFFRNAGRSRVRGVEATARLASWRGHGLRVTWSRTDARFRDSDDDPRGLAGNRVPGTATHLVDAALDGGVGDLRFGLDLRRIGDVPVDDEGTAVAEGSTTLDLRVGWSTQVGRARLAPWATLRNLTDELWVSSVVVNAFGGRFYEPGPGRTFDVGLTVEWGGGGR